ncbi:MAG: hypothetical protein ACYSUI_18840, partial [Planctomycetota bacterium]
IYGFIYRKLVEASVKKDPTAVDDALRVLDIERETWVLLIEKVNTARPPVDPSDGEPGAEHSSLCVEG